MSDRRISRKDFLRMMASAGAVMGLGAMGFGGGLIPIPGSKNRAVQNVFASSPGSWALGPNLHCIPIHAMLLRTGKILYIAGSADLDAFKNGPFKAGLLDVATNSQTDYDMPEDIFCSGHCQLPNGNILVLGGTSGFPEDNVDGEFLGLKSAYEFDAGSETFVKGPSPAHGRWYPTCVTLANGNVMTTTGLDEFGCNNALTEIYDSTTKNFTMSFDPATSVHYCVGQCSAQPGAGSPCYGSFHHGANPKLSLYARMHLLPTGYVAVCGTIRKLWMWDPATGAWNSAGEMIFGNRGAGTSTLLPLHNTLNEEAKILAAGGSKGGSSTASSKCEILEANGNHLNPREIPSMAHARRYHNCVILPTGKIMVVGGAGLANKFSTQVYVPEVFDPETETWSTLPAQTMPRRHHSEALLLPDGRVFSIGPPPKEGSPDLRYEIFSPWYMFETRPTISGALTGGAYGGSITIPTPDASGIASVSLVRIGTATHGTNSDQRLIWLQITGSTSSSVTVRAPLNANIAPPGYYVIQVLNSAGVPSPGTFMQIPS